MFMPSLNLWRRGFKPELQSSASLLLQFTPCRTQCNYRLPHTMLPCCSGNCSQAMLSHGHSWSDCNDLKNSLPQLPHNSSFPALIIRMIYFLQHALYVILGAIYPRGFSYILEYFETILRVQGIPGNAASSSLCCSLLRRLLQMLPARYGLLSVEGCPNIGKHCPER